MNDFSVKSRRCLFLLVEEFVEVLRVDALRVPHSSLLYSINLNVADRLVLCCIRVDLSQRLLGRLPG